jgi:phospholipase/carboxylesterase
VLLIHGDADEVVPVQALYAAIDGLQAASIAVQWSIREGLPHAFDPESIEQGAEFIDAALRGAARPADLPAQRFSMISSARPSAGSKPNTLP